MEICIIINYKTKLDVTIKKKHLLIGTTAILLFAASLKYLPLLISDIDGMSTEYYYDEVYRRLAKIYENIPRRSFAGDELYKSIVSKTKEILSPTDAFAEELYKTVKTITGSFDHEPTRSMYETYLKDMVETFKLKLAADNVENRKEIIKYMQEHPIQRYPFRR